MRKRRNPDILVPLGLTENDRHEFEDEDLWEDLQDALVVVETEATDDPNAILIYDIWGPDRNFSNDFEYEAQPFAQLYAQRRTLPGALQSLREIFSSLDDIDTKENGCCPIIFTTDDKIPGPLSRRITFGRPKYTDEEFRKDQADYSRLRDIGRKLDIQPVLYNWKIRGNWIS